METLYFKEDYAEDVEYCQLLCRRFQNALPRFLSSMQKIEACSRALQLCRTYRTFHPLAAVLMMPESPDPLLVRPVAYFYEHPSILPAIPGSLFERVILGTIEVLEKRWANVLLEVTKSLVAFPASLATHIRDKVDVNQGESRRYHLIEALNNESESWNKYLTAVIEYHLEVATARNSKFHELLLPFTTTLNHLETAPGAERTEEAVRSALEQMRDGFAVSLESSLDGGVLDERTVELTESLIEATRNFIGDHYYDIAGAELDALLPEVIADADNDNISDNDSLPRAFAFALGFLDLMAAIILEMNQPKGAVRSHKTTHVFLQIAERTKQALVDADDATGSTFLNSALPAYFKIQQMTMNPEVMAKIIKPDSFTSVRTGRVMTSERDVEAEIMASPEMLNYLRSDPAKTDPAIRDAAAGFVPLIKNAEVMHEIESMCSNPIHALYAGGVVSRDLGKIAISLRAVNGKGGPDPTILQALVQAMDKHIFGVGTTASQSREEWLSTTLAVKDPQRVADNLIAFPIGSSYANGVNHFLAGGRMSAFSEPVDSIFSQMYRLSNHVASIEHPGELVTRYKELAATIKQREGEATHYVQERVQLEPGVGQFVANFQSNPLFPRLVQVIVADFRAAHESAKIRGVLRPVMADNDDETWQGTPLLPSLTDVLSPDTIQLMKEFGESIKGDPALEDFNAMIALSEHEELESTQWCYTAERVALEQKWGQGLWLDETSPLDIGIYKAIQELLNEKVKTPVSIAEQEGEGEQQSVEPNPTVNKPTLPRTVSFNDKLKDLQGVRSGTGFASPDDDMGSLLAATAARAGISTALPPEEEFSSTGYTTTLRIWAQSNPDHKEKIDKLRLAFARQLRSQFQEFADLRSTLAPGSKVDDIDLMWDSTSDIKNTRAWPATIPGINLKLDETVRKAMAYYLAGICTERVLGIEPLTPHTLEQKLAKPTTSEWLFKLVKACGDRSLPIMLQGFNANDSDSRNLYWWLMTHVIEAAIRFQMVLEMDLEAVRTQMARKDLGDLLGDDSIKSYNNAVLLYLSEIEKKTKKEDAELEPNELEFLRLNYLKAAISHYSDEFHYEWSSASIARIGHTLVTSRGQRKTTAYSHLVFTFIFAIAVPRITGAFSRATGIPKVSDFAMGLVQKYDLLPPPSPLAKLGDPEFDILRPDAATDTGSSTNEVLFPDTNVDSLVESDINEAKFVNSTIAANLPAEVAIKTVGPQPLLADIFKKLEAQPLANGTTTNVAKAILQGDSSPISAAISNIPQDADYTPVIQSLEKIYTLGKRLSDSAAVSIPELGILPAPQNSTAVLTTIASTDKPTVKIELNVSDALKDLNETYSLQTGSQTPKDIAQALDALYSSIITKFTETRTAVYGAVRAAALKEATDLVKKVEPTRRFKDEKAREEYTLDKVKSYAGYRQEQADTKEQSQAQGTTSPFAAATAARDASSLLHDSDREGNHSTQSTLWRWAGNVGGFVTRNFQTIVAALKRGNGRDFGPLGDGLDWLFDFLQQIPLHELFEVTKFIVTNRVPLRRYVTRDVNRRVNVNVPSEVYFDQETVRLLDRDNLGIHLGWIKTKDGAENVDFRQELSTIPASKLKQYITSGSFHLEMEHHMAPTRGLGNVSLFGAAARAVFDAGKLSVTTMIEMLGSDYTTPIPALIMVSRSYNWTYCFVCMSIIIALLVLKPWFSSFISSKATQWLGPPANEKDFVSSKTAASAQVNQTIKTTTREAILKMNSDDERYGL